VNVKRIKKALTRKLGPLPAWAWLALLAAALYMYRRNHAPAAGAVEAGVGGGAGDLAGYGDYADYGGGGGGGGGPLPPDPLPVDDLPPLPPPFVDPGLGFPPDLPPFSEPPDVGAETIPPNGGAGTSTAPQPATGFAPVFPRARPKRRNVVWFTGRAWPQFSGPSPRLRMPTISPAASRAWGTRLGYARSRFQASAVAIPRASGGGFAGGGSGGGFAAAASRYSPAISSPQLHFPTMYGPPIRINRGAVT
jgi:hypothetical protein